MGRERQRNRGERESETEGHRMYALWVGGLIHGCMYGL